ncbi:MAG: hypothetical protein K9M96_08910 [Deltaproteobacteria bacterium]|nr:hypothetical protein [Deltaproteobacteria bacterium]
MKNPPACLACSEQMFEVIQPVFIKRILGGHWGRQCGQVENLARYIIRASFSQESPSWRAKWAVGTIENMVCNEMVES